ncbi:MAG: aldo/keto reductase [Candidatus Dormibacteraeota bacterium]|nr:aldo/keto reductase [Candidatus Dormibacteraeota bacterium]
MESREGVVETVSLGRSGLQVSRLCLGTMIFGSQVDEPAAFAVLDRAWELGIDFVDTADVYPTPPSVETAGRTEEIVGRWLTSRGAQAVVATKCVNRVGPRPNDSGGSRKHVIEACEASLRRLGRERIDILYLHNSALQAPLDETLEALDRLLQAGKFHYVGLSNFEAWQLGLALEIAAERRLARVIVLQPRYNLLARAPERDLLPLCRAKGIGVVPYNPLGAGMLTGKYRRGQEPPEGSRFALGDYGRMYRERYWSDLMFDVSEAVSDIAQESGHTPAQVALAWLLAQDGVTAPIVGASRPEQLDDSVGAIGFELSAEQLDRLAQVSQPFL